MNELEPIQLQISSITELFARGELKDALEHTNALIKNYPDDSLLLNIRGACYAGMGQLDYAIRDYHKAISIKPDYYKAHYNLGSAFQEVGQLEASVSSLQKSIAIQPNYAEAHNNLGNVFRELNQIEDSIKSFEKAIAIKPNYVEAYYSLGNSLKDLHNFDAAINCFEKVLTIKPDFTEMHNNLGVMLQELGQIDYAISHLEAALLIDPEFSEAHNNLGNILKIIGKVDEAVSSYKKAISSKSDFAEAHFNLGTIYQEIKQFDNAVKQYEIAISIKPDYLEAHNNLGITFKELKNLDLSVASLKKAISINPEFAEANYNLGTVLLELKQFDNAVIQYERAISIKPDYLEAHNNLGVTFKELNLIDVAIKSYKDALIINPSYAEAHNNLGNAFKDLGKPYAAVKSYKKTLSIKPDYEEAINNLGIIFMQIGQLNDAAKCFSDALNINLNFTEAHNNLGIVFNMQGHLDDSLKSYEKALAINPTFADAHSNLGNLMIDLKRLDEAVINYNIAYSIDPKIAFNLGNLLHTKMHLCIWDSLLSQLEDLEIKIKNNEKVIDPFSLLALIDDPKLHKKNAELYIEDKYPQNNDLPAIRKYPAHKKIRVGYFSADFRVHPVANLTAELYEIHDRSNFEVYAFSFGPETNDEMNLRIKAGVDYFHDVRSMPHKEVAMLARSVELDIAIDLGGFTQDTRTGIFAMKAAPIQVNYLGYSSTMGAEYMNYIIADLTLIPKDNQQHYSEKIVYLPDSFMVNDTKNKKSAREFTREEVGLPSDGFVFCCFNHHYKITPLVFASWMRILTQVSGSVLWLSDGNETGISNLKKEAEKNGVDGNRLIFAPRLELREDHLSRIKLADLFLDTLPYNAHATTSDALQAGLPVLTCIGESFASRVAASLINSVDLPELIVTTQDEYELLAIELATEYKKLKIIKNKLNNNLSSSPLYNTPLYVKQIESAYLEMYERYQKGLEPEHIYV